MLKLFAAMAPPIALLLVGVLLLEPPALTPGERVPTLRLLAGPTSSPLPTDRHLDPDPLAGDIVLPVLTPTPEAATAVPSPSVPSDAESQEIDADEEDEVEERERDLPPVR